VMIFKGIKLTREIHLWLI